MIVLRYFFRTVTNYKGIEYTRGDSMNRHIWIRMRKKHIKDRISSEKICVNLRNTEKSLLFKNKLCYDTCENNGCQGGKSMLFGDIVKERLKCLGMTFDDLIEVSMLDKDLCESICENRLSSTDLDEFDLSVLSSTLYCDPNYFTDENIRNKDVVFCSCNRGDDTPQSNLIKAKLQSYMRDLLFVKGCE